MPPALPLASATGFAVTGGAVGASLLALWWLLRAESRDAQQEEAEEAAEQAKQPQSGGPQPS